MNYKRALTILGVVLGLTAYTVAIGYGSVWWYQKQQTDQQNAIDPRKVVQESLVKNLDLTSVKRHITYRDNADRGMLVDWDLTSDFSNPRDPKSKGFLTLTWLRDKTEYKQKLEMVLLTGKNYSNTGYFRVVEGAELTNAPKDWFKIDTFYGYSDSGNRRSDPMYQRQGSYSYGKDSFGSIFGKTPYADAMKNFRGFDFTLYNSPAMYIVMSKMRDGNDKTELAGMIRNNQPYVMQNCAKNATEAWCDGQTNSDQMQAVSAKFYESEGFGGHNLTFDAMQFWMVADVKTGYLKKLELSAYGNDKCVTEFSAHNQPVTIVAP